MQFGTFDTTSDTITADVSGIQAQNDTVTLHIWWSENGATISKVNLIYHEAVTTTTTKKTTTTTTTTTKSTTEQTTNTTTNTTNTTTATTATTATTTTTTPVAAKGDASGDGVLDTNDVFEAMLYVAYCGAGMSGNLTDDQIAAADIDGDGSVDSTDVYYILYYVALQGAGKNPTWDFILGRK